MPNLIYSHGLRARSNMRGLAKKVLRGVYPAISSRYSQEIGAMIKALLIVDPDERPSCDDILKMDSVVSTAQIMQLQAHTALILTACDWLSYCCRCPACQCCRRKMSQAPPSRRPRGWMT